jgi:signal transduction histidine kinase/HAMP domain-containing protein
MQIQDAFHSARLLLREILGTEGLMYVEKLREQLEIIRSRVAQIVTNPLLDPEQRQLLTDFHRDWRLFLESAHELIERRQAADWNMALHRMATETDPLATRVIALTTAIATDARTLLKQEADAARNASIATVWILVLLILAMLVVAYGMSSARARTLARPITALAEATRRLAAGRLSEDIPVSGNDELAELTRSFNTMRASLQQAQAELREVNTLLEQRVGQRTTQLAAINRSLTREIAERSQADHALRESEARLRAMAQAIPDLVFVVDEEGCYREILAAGRDRVAIGNTPIRGKLLSEIHSPDMAKFFLDIIHQALKTQQIQVAEYELTTTSGRRWFESRTTPLDVRFADQSPVTTVHPQGNLFGPPELRRFTAKSAAIVIVRDITQRKHAEAQLRQAQKMQAIGQLTGGIAHDFNNLLAVIMGNLELLHEQLTAQPQLHELAQQALSAVGRGANLTQRLLAFSRRQPLLAQRTDLNKLVLGMLDLMRRTLGPNIRIDTALASDLEQTLVDPAQFENALLNLVINARDAMPQGGKLTLETANILIEDNDAATQAEVRPGPYVMLAVSDTGVGMEPELLERAFEPFFTTKETGKGSGLGLSMVYGLVKQSNGHITIQSEPGQGATVRLYLPRIMTSAPAATESHAADTPIRGLGETILVVEDDAEVRQFAVNALQGMGYEPLQAADAATALKILETSPQIALLFTDIVMPGAMDGVKLAVEAQRRYPGLRVLLTSGYTEHALIGNGQPAEGVEVLTKPYRINDLGKKLRLLLGQRGNS